MERRQLDSRDKWGEMNGSGTYVTCLSFHRINAQLILGTLLVSETAKTTAAPVALTNLTSPASYRAAGVYVLKGGFVGSCQSKGSDVMLRIASLFGAMIHTHCGHSA